MNTEDLIKKLSNDDSQVVVLYPPWLRVFGWMLVSALSVALVVWIFGVRPDIAVKIREWRFMSEQALTALTAVIAAYAAFCAIVPGRHKILLLLPLVPLVGWLSILGYGCLQDLTLKSQTSVFFVDWMCFPSIVAVGAVPAIVMAIMLRRGAPLYPHLAVAFGGLAAAAVGNFGLRLFHMVDAGILVLIWQFGSVMLLTLLSGYCGRMVHSWNSLRQIKIFA